MRIIAGTVRGKKIRMPEEKATRPFLEVARGALFNILGPDIRNTTVLDLFAGSGALGLEALSRGAAHATFVERSKEALATLTENITACRMNTSATVLQEDVLAAVQHLDLTTPFDIIFCDPPFADTQAWHAHGGAEVEAKTASLLRDTGVLVFRLEKESPAMPCWGNIPIWKDRVHGRSRLCLYRRIGL